MLISPLDEFKGRPGGRHEDIISNPNLSDKMPYNTTAIPPRKEVTGQTQLPRKRTVNRLGLP